MTLIKTSFLSLIETSIKLGAGLIIIKLLAIQFGREGVALFGQFQNFINLYILTATGAYNTGLVRLLAEKTNCRNEQINYLQSSIGLGLIVSLFVSLITFSMAQKISFLLFDSGQYAFVFKLFSVSFPLFMLFQISLAFLNGLGEVNYLILSKISSSIVMLVLTILLVILFQFFGALLSQTLIQALALAFSLFFASKIIDFNWRWLLPKFDTDLIKKLYPYFLMSIITTISSPLILIGIRTYIGDNLGWEVAGYWEAAWRLSELYLMLITTSLAIYYLPKLSAAQTSKAQVEVIKKVFLFCMSFSVIACGLAYYFRHLIILIVFSREFLSAAPLLSVFLLASLFKIAAWVFSYYMIARNKAWVFICYELLFGVSFYVFSITLIKKYGLIGAGYAALLNFILYLMGCFSYCYLSLNREFKMNIITKVS